MMAFMLCCCSLCEGQQADYNLGFEDWSNTVQFGSLSDMPTNIACYIRTAEDLEGIINNGSVQGDQILEQWSVIPTGLLRSTDAHSGNYAAVVCMWYNGATGKMSFGHSTNLSDSKVHFENKIYGVSGYYKYIEDSLDANDTYSKYVTGHIKAYKSNAASGALEMLSNDSLIFTQSETYQPFQLIVQNNGTDIVPDSVSIWFESNGYGSGITTCGLSHFLYLDDLNFHFSPMTNSVSYATPIQARISVFPNPATHNVRVQYDDLHIQLLQLTDLSGSVIKTFPPESKILDVSGLAAGVYFLNVKAEEGDRAEQIVLK